MNRNKTWKKTTTNNEERLPKGAVLLRWSYFFGQEVKVYSRALRRHWNEEETATIHGDIQEACGAGGAARGPHVQAIAAQHEVHPNQVKHLEAASDRRFGGGVLRRRIEAPIRAASDDPGSARADRRADGGTGFFSARVQTLSRCQRLRMIERNGKLRFEPPVRVAGRRSGRRCITRLGARAHRTWH